MEPLRYDDFDYDFTKPNGGQTRKKIMREIKVLDHGFVRLIEAWGTGLAGVDHGGGHGEPPRMDYEAGIIEAARQSTQGSFRGWEEDKKLLAYLFNNKHSTPFEMAGMTIEVKGPIFVFQEWFTHRTQSRSEMSARYAPLPDENYLPAWDRLFLGAGKNKQAQAVAGAPELTDDAARFWLDKVGAFYKTAQDLYDFGLQAGIPKELARIILPVGRYSQMRAQANLRNWLGFLTLRMDPMAQWEIRQYANAVGEIIKETFPRTWELFAATRK